MNCAEWQKTYIDKAVEQRREERKSGTLSGALVGALNDKNDPDGKKREKHAELYYKARRNSKKQPFTQRIAQNSGMRLKSVSKIFDHIFVNEHNLDGEIKRFDPSYYMAESFRRIRVCLQSKESDKVLNKNK